jgi:hypothetical protein
LIIYSVVQSRFINHEISSERDETFLFGGENRESLETMMAKTYVSFFTVFLRMAVSTEIRRAYILIWICLRKDCINPQSFTTTSVDLSASSDESNSHQLASLFEAIASSSVPKRQSEEAERERPPSLRESSPK